MKKYQVALREYQRKPCWVRIGRERLLISSNEFSPLPEHLLPFTKRMETMLFVQEVDAKDDPAAAATEKRTVKTFGKNKKAKKQKTTSDAELDAAMAALKE